MEGMQDVTQVISSVGFPIVACMALFWMINTTMKELKETIHTALNDLKGAILELSKSIDGTNGNNGEARHLG